MRVAVVDIGTNSTRILVAEVADRRVTEELVRDSRVTRLGQGVDATGRRRAREVRRQRRDRRTRFRAALIADLPRGVSRGAGLGLYVAKRLTEQLGGEIGFTSVKGRGSRFVATIPAG